MQHPPPLLEQTAVGHLVGEGMLKGVDLVGEEPGLVEQLCGLEVRQAALQCFLRQPGKPLQQRHGHLRANDRRDLHQAFGLRGRRSRRAASTAWMVSGSGREGWSP